MAVAVVGVGTVATATTGTGSPGLPAGWAAGHVHVLAIHSKNPVPAMTGWLSVGAGFINLSTGTATALTVRWRRAVGGDTAPTVPSTGTATTDQTVSRIIGFSGCPLSGDPWDVTLFATENVADTSVAFPNPSTTKPNTMVIHVVTTGVDTSTGQSSGAGTNAALTGLTNRMNNWDTSGGGGGFAMITGIKATAGAIGATTTTVTTAAVKCLFTGALRPTTAPIVSIGEDSWAVVGGTFNRVAVENDTGDPITAREWKVMSGPADAGNVVGTAVENVWAPTATGSYVVRYTATNGVGTSFDEVNLEVGGQVEGPQNSPPSVGRR